MKNLQVRCSGLYKLMSKPRNKTKSELYYDTEKKLDEETAKYEAIENKKTKTAANKLAKLSELTNQLNDLKPYKDQWELSETAKTWIKDEAKKLFYGYTTELNNKEVKKGHQNEDEAIEIIAKLEGKEYIKNGQRIELSWLTGEADIVNAIDKEITDIKNAWSLDTFPAFKEDVNKKVKDAGYDWQQKGYLMLWKYDRARIAYVMTSTPEELIPDWEDRSLHIVDDIDPAERVTYSDWITVTEEEIKEVKKAYKAANAYFKECLTELNNKSKK